jgi:methionyl-tRNA formyltransferase
MSLKSKKIIFFGNERLATGVSTKNPVLNSLLKNGFEVEKIILNQDDYNSRSIKINEAEEFGLKNHIPCLKPKTNDELEIIISRSEARLGILVSYGKIIPESIIKQFELGIINLHPSLLPKKRGPTPIEQTIIDGDLRSGVSIMKLTKGMDDGPIYIQKTIELKGNETKQELSTILGSLGADLIIDVLLDIFNENIDPRPQDDAQKSFTHMIIKSSGSVDWSDSSENIERKFRAYEYWPRSYTDIFGIRTIITDMQTMESASTSPGNIDIDSKKLIVSTSTNQIEILKLIPLNKKEISGHDFIQGYLKK